MRFSCSSLMHSSNRITFTLDASYDLQLAIVDSAMFIAIAFPAGFPSSFNL